jgi:hypothetical protein
VNKIMAVATTASAAIQNQFKVQLMKLPKKVKLNDRWAHILSVAGNHARSELISGAGKEHACYTISGGIWG